jgi:methionine-S-sulfoxide reductase
MSPRHGTSSRWPPLVTSREDEALVSRTPSIDVSRVVFGGSVSEERNPHRSVQGTPGLEVAVLAGGCFWGVEEILRGVPGVVDTEVGYTGGWLENPTYHDTHDGQSGHAEAVRITFDPSLISYEDLLEKWFFKLHDPTTRNRQGNDIGTQYRSAIFPQTPEQQGVAERVKARVEASGRWRRPITTTIEPASTWYGAEQDHQDYLRKHPEGYSCHFIRE